MLPLQMEGFCCDLLAPDYCNALYTHIQKHHRQPTRSVKRPPRVGLMQALIPNVDATRPIHIGRFSKGVMKLMAPNAPWMTPAAPTPAIALPRMKTSDRGAVAQRTEPTLPMSVCYSPHSGQALRQVRKRQGGAKGRESMTFKHQNRTQIYHFDIAELIHPTSQRLQGCHGQEVCRTIPAYVLQCFEVCRNLGNRYRDNGDIDGDQKGS